MIHRAAWLLAGTILLGWAPAAQAQRADENVTAAATDGFGKTVGSESIGIYASGDVRGFSAEDAGNARVEGLYFNESGGITDVITSGSDIRLGLTAFGYPFPAPTGIVDTSLRRVTTDRPVVSVKLNSGEYLGIDGTIEAAVPLTDRLGVNASLGLFDDRYVDGASAWFVSYGTVLRWKPADGVELTGFYGRYDYGDEEQGPTIYTDGNRLPPRIERQRFFGQDWAQWAGHSQNYGSIARAARGAWKIEVGLFNSRFTQDDYASAWFEGVDAQGLGREFVLSGKDQRFASTSGELRISREFREGDRLHRVIASVRGRSVQSLYGGYDLADLGTARIGIGDPVPEPIRNFSARTDDRVRQLSYALGYELRWREIGELNLGLTRTNYRKRVSAPGLATAEAHDRPWLWNAALAVHATDRITLYVAATRGLEESGTAPGNAVNANEALPALRTRQQEAGLRVQLPHNLRLAAALFDLEKPYFEIDSSDGIYRTLGTVGHRGLELSLSGEPLKGLNFVAGAVLLNASVSGEAVDDGRLGSKPIGRTPLLVDLNLDYRFPAFPALSLDAGLLVEGRRTANVAGTLELPARATLDLGARYRFKLGKSPTTLRAQLLNATNVYGWRVSSGGGFEVNKGRRMMVSVTADF